MHGHGWTLGALLILLLPAASHAQQTGRPSELTAAARYLLEDAELADVWFVDAQIGWAVGDRGAIWHTHDGGLRWSVQPSGVDCRLESVHFIDQRRGWAAGRSTAPYTHTSHGLLLKTDDGGQTWVRDNALVLPGIRRVKFFSATSGWVLGDASAVFPTGIFATDDGGRTWSPIASQSGGDWLAGDFVDPLSGAVTGRHSVLAAVRQRGIRPAQTPSLGMRTVRRLELQLPTSGWLVGDGGLVMKTDDLGIRWQLPTGELPPGVADHFDFRALATAGEHCWIAGTPGTQVLHSPDGGQTWDLQPTGHHAPIAALHFVDESHGWAVGSLGNILHTADGGRIWRMQRSGGARAAILGIYARASDVPLELFALLSGNDGYLGRVHVLGREDLDAPRSDASSLYDRTHAALVGVGAGGAETSWRFPLRDTGLLLPVERVLQGFDAANDGAGLDRLEVELVRNIRLWRPEVLFTNGANPRGDDPLGHLVHQVVVHAVDQAADPTRFPLLAGQLGLTPWQVKKVYSSLPPGEQGTENLTTSQLAPRLERSLAEYAASARGLLGGEFAAPRPLRGFDLAVNRLPQGSGNRGFLGGIHLAAGGDARRKLAELADRDLDQLRNMARRHRDLQAILSRIDQQNGAVLLAQLGDLTNQLRPDSAATTLFHLGRQLHNTGNWRMAADVFELLARRHPDHPLAGSALVWLVQFYSSDEAAWRDAGSQRYTAGQMHTDASTLRSVPPLGQILTDAGATYGPGSRIRQRSTLAVDARADLDRPAKAAEMAALLKQLQPTLYEEPTVRFPLSAADRRQGFSKQADAYYLSVRSLRPHDAWWACAAGERWLAEASGAPPKDVMHCAAATRKPRLDGLWDDDLWQAAEPALLHSRMRDDEQWPAAVRLGYDEEFLYLAVECRKAPGAAYESTDEPRPRDADLSEHDRVELFFDLDRDGVTAWKLTVDHRGWTGDACWGDTSWNPTWFVAAWSDQETWRVEAAIPLDQLTGAFPTSKTVWAAGAQRIVPGVGFQSWTTPAATHVAPEGFGYLIFE